MDETELGASTVALRHVDGPRKLDAIRLVHELTGAGLKECKDVVDCGQIFLRGIEPERAREIAERFEAVESQIELIDEPGFRYAYDPEHPLRGDQPVERLRWTRTELALERGRAGEWRSVEKVVLGSAEAVLTKAAQQCATWREQGLALASDGIELLRSVSAREPRLEAEIRAAADPRAAIEVYADWLQSVGDPRGVLAMTGLAIEHESDPEQRSRLSASFDELLVRHRAHLFGPVALALARFELGWCGGLVERISFVAERVEAALGLNWPESAHELEPASLRSSVRRLEALGSLASLLALPICSCIRALRSYSTSARAEELEQVLDGCDHEQLAGLRELWLEGDGFDRSFSRWDLLAGLERLSLVCRSDMQPLSLARLRELSLTGRQCPEVLTKVVAQSWLPSLEALTLTFDSAHLYRSGEPEPQHLAELLHAPSLASLRSLSLRGNSQRLIGPWLVETLLAAPALARLELLDLHELPLDPEAIEGLERARARLPPLRLPDLGG